MDDPYEDVAPLFTLKWWSYFLDFALVPWAVLILLIISVAGLDLGLVLVVVYGGIMLWTFIEYALHRWILHGRNRLEPMHQAHHMHPKAWIGVSSGVTFGGFGVLLGALTYSLGWPVGAGLTAGVMLGYLWYCGLHIWMHHGDRVAFGPYVRTMHIHHGSHHRGGKGNFGVTTPFWDNVLGTKL